MLKNTVADPQGQIVMTSGSSIGIGGLKDIRMGKMIQIKIEATDLKEAETKINEFSKKLLTNPIIENYQIVGGLRQL
jgi:phosphoribosylformylglycinamidine synthase